MQYSLPDALEFVEDMSCHWEKTLGNVPNDSLKDTWKQMADTFAEAISESPDSSNSRWRVLQPPTGTGKTQGLCLYLAKLMLENRKAGSTPIGSLVAVGFIRQAEEVRDTILGHLESATGQKFTDNVLTHHSECRHKPEALARADVSIITHAQYLKCFEDTLMQNEFPSGRWDEIKTWRPCSEHVTHLHRRLTVIDEALDIVRHKRVTVEDLSHAMAYISPDIREQFEPQIALLGRVKMLLHQADPGSSGEDRGRVLCHEEASDSESRKQRVSVEPLVEALEELPSEHFTPWTGKRDRSAMGVTRRKVIATVRNAATLMAHWAFYYQRGRVRSLNHSDLAVPLEMVNPVLLDATADQSVLLKLFGNRVDIKPCPKRSRLYSNVTLRPAKLEHGTGKHSMKKEANKRAALLFDNLKREIPAGSKVLIVCHKDVKPSLLGYELPGSDVAVAHYGALEGLNEWQDFDTVVLFGTLYRPRDYTIASYFAATGGPDESIFKGPTPNAGYKDVIEAISFGERMTTMIQAINRIRCRKVVDEHGNCSSATVFVTLPANESDEVIETLRNDMPGLAVGPEWDLQFGTRPKSRRSSFDDALVSLMDTLKPGRHWAGFIREQLGMKSDQWKKLVARKLSNPDDPLTRTLAQMGVTYERIGNGARGGKSSLVKA